MAENIRILHISDIHYSNENELNFETHIKKPFFEYLEKEKIEVDLICLTGDLINKGTGGFSTSDEGFVSFENNFLIPLQELLHISNQNVIFCPGNHDVNRELDTKEEEFELKRQVSSKDKLKKIVTEQKQIDKYSGIKRILPFKNFEKKYYRNNSESELSMFESVHIRTIKGKKLGILCLNSVWRCYDNDSQIILGKEQITDNQARLEDCDLKLLLSHYQLEKCTDIDTFGASFSSNYHLCLYGHTHSSGVISTADVLGRKTVISCSKGLIASNYAEDNANYLNGFSIFDVVFGDSELDITYTPLTYSSVERNTFVLDTISLGKNAPATFTLSKNPIKIEKIFNSAKKLEYKEYLNRLYQFDKSNYIERTTKERHTDSKKSLKKQFEKFNKIVLLGNAGMGKSVEALYFAETILQEDVYESFIPVVLKAKSYKIDYISIDDGIKKELYHFLNSKTDQFYLENINENIILILDGIDEVNNTDIFNSLVEDLNKFSSLHPHSFELVTSRINQYRNCLSGFKDVILQELAETDIRRILQKNRINETKFSKVYIDLFKNPFLLGLAINVYNQSQSTEFTRFYNKSKLLEECCLHLAGKRDYQKGLNLPEINYHEMFVEIGKIAFENYEMNTFSEIEFNRLFGSLFTSHSAFTKFRSELFVMGTAIEYKHRLFKEFLIAYYLFIKMPLTKDNSDFYKQLIKKDDFFEIISFISGMYSNIKEQDSFLDLVLDNNLELFLYCVINKNDLSVKLQNYSYEDFSNLYINTFYQTYSKILELYFPKIVNKIRPIRNKNAELCCFGCMSQNRNSFTYWFDRIENPQQKVVRIEEKNLYMHRIQYEKHCEENHCQMAISWINLNLSNLEGDTARFLAIKEVKKDLLNIIENQELNESLFLSCEYIELMKNCMKETYREDKIDNICDIYISKIETPVLVDGKKYFIIPFSIQETDKLKYQLLMLKGKDINLSDYTLPKEDQIPVRYEYEKYSPARMKEYLSKFFLWWQLSYKEMIESNFNKVIQYFPLYQDIPFQNVCCLKDNHTANSFSSILYYHVASTEIQAPYFVDESPDFLLINELMKKSYEQMGRQLHNYHVTNSYLGEFISPINSKLPLTSFVYNQIKNEIEKLFSNF